MIIHRNNYETFFLLYADKELDPGVAGQVEDFVAANPDLAEEFNALLDTRLDPAKDQYRMDKSSLRKPVGESKITPISEEDLESLLLYLDGELNSSQQEQLEQRMREHPELGKEMLMLEQTKLQPDVFLRFPDKSLLYHQEERSEKKALILTMNWVRLSAAAAVVLIAGLLWMFSVSKKTTEGTPALAQTTTGAGKEAGVSGGATDEPSLDANYEEGNTDVTGKKDQAGIALAQTAGMVQPKSNRYTSAIATGTPEKQALKQAGSMPVATIDPIPVLQEKAGAELAVGEVIVTEDVHRINALAVASDPKSEPESLYKSDYASEVLLRPEEAVEVVEAPEGAVRKGPFRSIVRKANRFINRVNNPDPNKPTMKVAAFEIALAR